MNRDFWLRELRDLLFLIAVAVSVCAGLAAAIGYGFVFWADFDLTAPAKQNVLMDGFFRRTMECVGIFVSVSIAAGRSFLVLVRAKRSAQHWQSEYGWMAVLVQVLSASMLLTFFALSIVQGEPFRCIEAIGFLFSICILVWSFFDFLRWREID